MLLRLAAAWYAAPAAAARLDAPSVEQVKDLRVNRPGRGVHSRVKVTVDEENFAHRGKARRVASYLGPRQPRTPGASTARHPRWTRRRWTRSLQPAASVVAARMASRALTVAPPEAAPRRVLVL